MKRMIIVTHKLNKNIDIFIILILFLSLCYGHSNATTCIWKTDLCMEFPKLIYSPCLRALPLVHMAHFPQSCI